MQWPARFPTVHKPEKAKAHQNILAGLCVCFAAVVHGALMYPDAYR